MSGRLGQPLYDEQGIPPPLLAVLGQFRARDRTVTTVDILAAVPVGIFTEERAYASSASHS